MVLTEAVRMAEVNSSPLNNILANNSAVMTSAGINAGQQPNNDNSNTKLSSPTRLIDTAQLPQQGQSKLPPAAERPMLGTTYNAEQPGSHTSSRNKQPIYTRDKRTKFTQRENKKWVRLATVLGYLVAVCIPAIALSIYYIGFWDPNYKAQYVNYLQMKEQERKAAASPQLHQQQQQQCSNNCACPTTQGSVNGANREARHLQSEHGSPPSVDISDGDPAKIAASRFIYDGVGERAAEHAYYHNVLMGKNYAIYGAASDESSSVDNPLDPSSPDPPSIIPSSTLPPSDSTAPPGIHIGSPPSRAIVHEKRAHATEASSPPHQQQHRPHKTQVAH